jgi:sialidase-1
MNVMSVSLLRLQDGSICLFYLRKNSVHDCRPYVRRSTDDGKTWGDPVPCLDGEGYWVLNNDWVVMLRSGRLVFPVALHTRKGSDYNHRGIATVWFSDDSGGTWHPSETKLHCPTDSGAGFQEPGVVQLKEGRLLMFIRTRLGRQYYSYSKDEGTTWSPGEPSPLLSPLSPASIKRIPSTGDLLAVWNDHEGMPSEYRASERGARPFGGKRTPLTLAVSRDKGRTWQDRRNLLTDPAGWYCYTAIHFTGDNVLLGFASGGSGLPELSKMDVAVVPIASLYS